MPSALMPTLHLPVSKSRVPDKKEVLGIRPSKPPEGFHDELNTQREADRVTVNQFAPPGVLINSNLEILQFRGPTSAYLVPPTDTASLLVPRLPPSSASDASGVGVRPRCDMMLTTPDSASLPNTTLFGSRSASMRSHPMYRRNR